MKNTRLRNGIHSLIKIKGINIGTYICLFIMLYTVFISKNNNVLHFNQTVRIIIILIAFTLLLYYWNHRITQTYKEKLRLANEKSLEDELVNKLAEIETLKADNNRLAKIIHKDNKLIPAMHMAVTDFLENIDKLSSILFEVHPHTPNTIKTTNINTIIFFMTYLLYLCLKHHCFHFYNIIFLFSCK